MAADVRLAAHFARPEPVAEQSPIWVPCARCGGQRREFAQGSEGSWFVRACPDCLGIGDVPSTGGMG